MEESSVKLKREDFINLLIQEFPNTEITTLGSIVQKISLVANVRFTDKYNLDYYDYYEISLKDVDNFGVIKIIENKKHLGAASKELVDKYALKANDILLSYRGTKRITVARIGDNYNTTLVANSSTIRIAMKKGTSEDLAIMIQAYLNLDFIQSYLLSNFVQMRENGKYKRYLLSVKELNNLPIPNFQINTQYNFKELYQRRLILKEYVNKLITKTKDLNLFINNLQEISIKTYLNFSQTFPSLETKENNLLKKLENILKEIEEFDKDSSIK